MFNGAHLNAVRGGNAGAKRQFPGVFPVRQDIGVLTFSVDTLKLDTTIHWRRMDRDLCSSTGMQAFAFERNRARNTTLVLTVIQRLLIDIVQVFIVQQATSG